MEYGGKISNRFWMPKQIGTDDAMADEIRSSASVDQRPVRDQIRFLLMLGIERRREQVSQGKMPQRAHTPAHLRTSQNSSHSQERTRQHKDSHPGQLPLPGTVGPVEARKRRIA